MKNTITTGFLILALATLGQTADVEEPLPTIAQKTAGLERAEGLLTTWYADGDGDGVGGVGDGEDPQGRALRGGLDRRRGRLPESAPP